MCVCTECVCVCVCVERVRVCVCVESVCVLIVARIGMDSWGSKNLEKGDII